jgi:uncharacterized protein (DUF1330 family)
MSVPKAYIVTEVELTGSMEVFQRDYAAHVQATVEPYGGRYLVRGRPQQARKASRPKGRIVISVFPSMEKAQAWRNSPEYRKIAVVPASARPNRGSTSSRACRRRRRREACGPRASRAGVRAR